MIEKKFRAWDRKHKEWITCGLWIESYHKNGPVLFGISPYDKDKVEIMQFTGLLDKNQKEIWEGDIVEYSPPIWYPNGGKTRRLVEWKGAGFNLIHINNSVYEIIGNIWENPELLESGR